MLHGYAPPQQVPIVLQRILKEAILTLKSALIRVGSSLLQQKPTFGQARLDTIINSASIISPIDPASNNKTATDTTTVIPQTDLLVEVSAPVTVATSTALTYTLTITNTGPSAATGIELTNTLTNTVTLISTSPDLPACEHDSGVIHCDLGGLASGSSVKVLISVTSPGVPGPFPNIVEIKGNEPDPNPANDTQTTVVIAT